MAALLVSPIAAPQAIAEYETRRVARRLAFMLKLENDEMHRHRLLGCSLSLYAKYGLRG
jgi:hypothetical protein